MLHITTERLEITPFTSELIVAAKTGDRDAIERFGVVATSGWPDRELRDALPLFDALIDTNGIDGFNSWLITDRESHEILGSVGFLGRPGRDGRVEIGFGIVPEKRRRGYCSEAVRALLGWAFDQKGVITVTARCDPGNRASRAVLAGTVFRHVGELNGQMVWERGDLARDETVDATEPHG